MKRAWYLAISLAVVALDAWTKHLIMENFAIGRDLYVVIPRLFQIVHVRNTGAAFGIGNGSGSPVVPLLLNLGAIAVFAIVTIYSLRAPLNARLLQTGLHLIIGGAIGNLIDRFTLGSVVDFLDVFVVIGGREHHWPAFNVADSAICIGIAILFIDSWRSHPESAEEETPSAS